MHADFNRAPYLDKLHRMNPLAAQIQQSLQAVSGFRLQHAAQPELAIAVSEIKRFQSRRFEASYGDLLSSPRYSEAAGFFLHELYSDKNYAERDQQFARIANTIAKLFPQSVLSTAAALAQVHALTEALDDQMARQWLGRAAQHPPNSSAARYIDAWKHVGDATARYQQLDVVLNLGNELDRLTRKPGLRTLLKLMRGPAAAAGLSALQGFLEAGFDAFARMRGADEFLGVVKQRETVLIRSLFEDEQVACETAMAHLMAQTRV